MRTILKIVPLNPEDKETIARCARQEKAQWNLYIIARDLYKSELDKLAGQVLYKSERNDQKQIIDGCLVITRED